MKPKKVKKKSNNQFLWAAAMEMETFCDLVEKKTFISMKVYNLLFYRQFDRVTLLTIMHFHITP